MWKMWLIVHRRRNGRGIIFETLLIFIQSCSADRHNRSVYYAPPSLPKMELLPTPMLFVQVSDPGLQYVVNHIAWSLH